MSGTKALFFGMSTIDCIYLIDQPPGRNEKIVADQQLICTGGPSTNAAITFSALGGKSTLISCLGSHPLASIARNELKIHGVDHMDLCPEYSDVPTLSSILISKDNGDRSVVSVNATHIKDQLLDMKVFSPLGFETVLFDGQHMSLSIPLARQCHSNGIHTILDGGSWKAGTETLIRHIDTAICSSNFMPPGITAPEKILSWLHDQGVLRVAITRGHRPILASENGNRFEIPVPTVCPVRDTLGAGDIFHGAYGYYQSEKPTGKFNSHLQKAAAIAARSCTHFGPRKWIGDLPVEKK